MKEYSFKELRGLECKFKLWDITYDDVPVWFYMRGKFQKNTPPTTVVSVAPKRLFFSLLDLIRFAPEIRRSKYFVFISGRDRLVALAQSSLAANGLLNSSAKWFIKHERGCGRVGPKDALDAYCLECARYAFRVSARLLAFCGVRQLSRQFLSKVPGLDPTIVRRSISDCVGDVWFAKFLSRTILVNGKSVWYSCCVIPMGEKFVNRFSSLELQHGVIHGKHPGYSYLPYVKNKLALYDGSYKKILDDMHYPGAVEVNSADFDVRSSDEVGKSWDVVIFSSVNKEYSQIIDAIDFSKYLGRVALKKHPRDQYQYQVPDEYVLDSYTPTEIVYPITLNSTVIDDFSRVNREVCIFRLPGFEDEEFSEYMSDIQVVYGRLSGFSARVVTDLEGFLDEVFDS